DLHLERGVPLGPTRGGLDAVHRFDPDDLRAPLSKKLRAVWPSPGDGNLRDPDTLEGEPWRFRGRIGRAARQRAQLREDLVSVLVQERRAAGRRAGGLAEDRRSPGV